MSSSILVVMESLSPLGPAAGWWQAAAALRRAGFDLHVALTGIRDRPIPADLPATVHQLRRGRGDRLWAAALRKLARAIRPDTIHFMASSTFARSALSGIPARRVESFSDESAAIVELERRVVLPDLIMAPLWPGDVAGRPTLDVRGRAIPVARFRPGWPSGSHPSGTALPAIRAAVRQTIQQRFSIPESAMLVGTTARLAAASPLKNLIWATDLLACIRDDVHLIVFGQGIYRPQLERFSRLVEATNHVHFIGEPDDAMDMLRSMDMVWMTGEDEATVLIAGLAMEARIPLVAVARPRLDGLLRHLQTALLVAADSRDGFARWTKFLLEQDQSRARLVEQAAAWNRQTMKPSDLPETLARIYRGNQKHA
jgi:glycosyltransferase involved in cell wall biosynthesis